MGGGACVCWGWGGGGVGVGGWGEGSTPPGLSICRAACIRDIVAKLSTLKPICVQQFLGRVNMIILYFGLLCAVIATNLLENLI